MAENNDKLYKAAELISDDGIDQERRGAFALKLLQPRSVFVIASDKPDGCTQSLPHAQERRNLLLAQVEQASKIKLAWVALRKAPGRPIGTGRIRPHA